jgi:predicted ATPase
MWLEELTLENIRCFEKATMKFSEKEQPARWITFLGENGGGKSTALQALGLLLAGPEGAQQLLTRPLGWVRLEDQVGKISTRIHQSDNDPGQYGEKRIHRAFGYTYFMTGSQPITIRNKKFTEPTIVENKEKRLTWLRQNAFTSKGKGWFAVGYGAFRRLTRSHQIIIPSLEPPARFNNFTTQFDEDQPLAAFDRWMVYLDFCFSRRKDKSDKNWRHCFMEC